MFRGLLALRGTFVGATGVMMLRGGFVGRAELVSGATLGESSVDVDSMWASMVVGLGEASGRRAVGGGETEWTGSGFSC